MLIASEGDLCACVRVGDEKVPGGVDVLGEGARQRDHIGDAVVFDVGEADLVVHLV